MTRHLRTWRIAALLAAVLSRRTFLYASVRSSSAPSAASKYASLVLLGFLLALLVSLLHSAQPAVGLSLKMQPLIYRDTLAKGEKKKGFIDVSNPTGEKLHLKTSVQAFRQVNDNGSLQFFDEPQVGAGIIPDLDEFELGPRQALRMYFLIDGTKLPPGDVFASLFVATTPTQKSGSVSALRLGTLFVLTNGTAGAREAAVTDLNVGFWQFGSGINGSFTVKNTAKAGSATGFFPSVTVGLDPLHRQQQVDAKLVFAGRTRSSEFQLNTSRLGFYKVSAVYGQSKQEKWVFMATGYWRWVALAIVALGLLAAIWWLVRRRRLSFQRR